MRYLYFACFGLLVQTARGQAADSLAVSSVAADSVAIDSTSYAVAPDERWVRSQADSTGECTEVMHWSGLGGLVRVYHPSGRLKDYLPYGDLAAGKLHGVATTWFDDGQLAVRQTFLKGQRDGELVAYYPDGQLKRQTQYANGNEMLGQCFAPSGAPIPFFPYEQPPLYPGGELQLIKEISRHVRQWQSTRPLIVSQAQIHITFQIEENGRVENPKVVITDEMYGMLIRAGNNQALQAAMSEGLAPLISRVQHGLTSLARPFYPGKRDGAAVRWQYSFTIPFTISGRK